MNVHLVVSGRVQGVGFRFTAQQFAVEYGLNGWVQNQVDGTVELEVEGPETKIDEFISIIKNGFNQFVIIDDVKTEKTNKEKGYNEFSIR